MLFACWDYYLYRRRLGRFSDKQNNEMAFSFLDAVPDDVIKQLNEGDFIFTQRLDSFWSWALMYYASSNVDHSAIYGGEGMVGHMTLAGGRLHSLRAVTKGARVIIVRMSSSELNEFSIELTTQLQRIDKGSDFRRALPPKFQFFIGGLSLIHCKYPDRFKFKFFLEFFTSLIAISAVVYSISGYITLFFPPIVSVLFLSFYSFKNIIRFIRRQPSLTLSYPDLLLKSFFRAGGLIFTNMGPLVTNDLIGILPLKVFLSLARQRADDSSNDDLEKTREFFRDLIEGWNLVDLTKETENQNSNKQNDKEVEEGSNNPRQSNEHT